MNDATLAWQKATSGNISGYQVTWTYNGVNQTPYTVPATAAQDASGYTQDFATSNPSIAVKGGDVIDATIVTLDATDSLQSAPVTPPAVTEPTSPVAPGVPQNVTLTLA